MNCRENKKQDHSYSTILNHEVIETYGHKSSLEALEMTLAFFITNKDLE